MSLEHGDLVRLSCCSVRVLRTADEIRGRVEEMAGSLEKSLGGTCPVFVCLLHGGFVFLADLIREYRGQHEIDFLKVSRYDPAQKDPTEVRVMHDLRGSIRNRDVVVVEGVRARGTKVEYVDRFLRLHAPRSLRYCAMVRPAGANLDVPLDETGFEVDDEFVIGYGLDYRENYRNLPFIGLMEPSQDPGPEPGHKPGDRQG